MFDTQTSQQILGVVALAVTLINGYLIYKGSDKASKRSADAQNNANATLGFQALTQEQRTEMLDLRRRAEESERSADHARDAAERAERAAERCQERETMLQEGYRELWEWAIQPCPHDKPPPRPPYRILNWTTD